MNPSLFAQILIRTLALYLVWHSFQTAGYAWATWTMTQIQVKFAKPWDEEATVTLAKWMIAFFVGLPLIFSVTLWKLAPRIGAWMTPGMSDVVIPFTAQTAQRLILQTIGVVLIAYSILDLPQVLVALLNQAPAEKGQAAVLVLNFFIKVVVGAGIVFAADKITRTFALWGKKSRGADVTP